VPRRQLGQIVPQLGRQFAGIVQPFLHNYGQITLNNIRLKPPCELDAIRRPKLEVTPKYPSRFDEPWRTISRQLDMPAADVPMPENIKDFMSLIIRFACTSILC
jgi:hypothetical protein